MWRFLDPSEILGDPLPTSYDPGLVILSVLVASIAAYAALLIADRLVTADTRRARWAWLATGSIGVGSGVWAMHFVGMLALSLPVSMSYSLPITLVSLGPGIFASAIALHVLSRSQITMSKLHGGGLMMAIGIGTMHYVGMEAMRMDAILRYSLPLFALSIVVAHLLATSALYVKFFRSRWSGLVGPWTGVGSALLMGLAVAGMHYTAMAAGSFFQVAAPGPRIPSASWPPIMVSLVGCGVTGLAIVCAIVDRHLQRLSTSLISTEERFRTLLDAAGEGILGLALDGTITFVNPALGRMLDRPVEGIVGLRLCRRGGKRPTPGWLDLGPSGRIFGTHLETCTGISGADYLGRPDGTLMPIDYTQTPLTVMGGASGSVVTLSDATARTQAKAELMTARDEALDAARAKGAFLATMSHEIRTPMNGVLGMSELLADTGLTDEQREFTDSIRSSAKALLHVINDVLDFSKIEAGKLELEASEFRPREVVDEVATLLTTRARQKGVELICSVGDDVPIVAVGDPGRFRQILTNLVGNAVKFTADGKVEIMVSVVDVQGDSETLRVAVRDSGIGIASDALEHIFDSFSQADGSMTRQYGGSGLGLTIAKSLTEMMGGEMAVESEAGQGSTFSFTARMKRAVTQDLAGPMDAGSNQGCHAGSAPGTVPDDLLANRRVLLVEDNPVNQAVARAMLEKLGCRVDLAENGVAALTAYGRTAYDVIVMDGQMPEMDGYETTRRLRMLEAGAATEGRDDGRAAHIPIVAMTAHAMKGDRERCLEAGMDDYLSKPFTRAQLAEVLQRSVVHGPTEVPNAAEDRDRDERTPDSGVIDETTLDELRALDRDGSDDSLRQVLTLYLEKSPQLMFRLAEAVETGDAETIGHVAHSLKSASANVGATELSRLCEDLERLGELVQKLGYPPAADKAGDTLAAIQAEYAAVQGVLSKMLADGAGIGSSQPIARAR